MLNRAMHIAAPSSSNTRETVVEVGSPKVLKTSSRITSVSITARKRSIMSENLNIPGWKIPFRATSIIPLEVSTPTRMPIAATLIIVRREAALEPMAEFRKFTASLETPTTRSETASTARIKTIAK